MWKRAFGTRWSFVILIILLSFLVYGRTLSYGFVAWDDNIHLFENPNLNPPTLSKLGNFWKEPYLGLYIPVTYSVWSAIAKLSYNSQESAPDKRLSPMPFRLTNLIIHTSNAILVFLILNLVLKLVFVKNPRPVEFSALAGTVVFLLHPLQVESVCWVTGLKDLLAAFFSFIAIYFYLAYLNISYSSEGQSKSQGWKSKSGYFCCFYTAFIFAVGSKPSAISLVFIFLIFNRWLFRRALSEALAPLIPLIIMSLCLVGLTFDAQGQNIYLLTPIPLRPLVALDALSFYLFKLFIPIGLCSDYGRTPQFLWDHPVQLLMCGLGIAAIWLTWRFRKRNKWILPCFGIFIAGLLPNLGFIPFVFQNFSTVADRYVYISLFGVALGLGIASYYWNMYFSMTCMLGTLVMGGISFLQASVWQDSMTFLNHNISLNSQSWFSYNNLGLYLQKQGQYEKAIPYHQKALQINPRAIEIEYNYGSALLGSHRNVEAIEHYQKVLEQNPNLYGIHNNLAIAYEHSGDIEKAIEHHRKSVEIKPDFVEGHYNLAQLLMRQGKVDEAANHLSEALKYRPDFEQARISLNAILAAQKH